MSTVSKAQLAKDKGNTAFKNGDFPSAIGHYSQAILEDPKNWTFPLNRAAAYLKLGKYQDAERDCTTVLELDVSNVKALFRRAQARRDLDKLAEAQKDLEQASSLDPSNESVKAELNVVKDLLWKKSTSDVVHPLRRRVPIRIVEPEPSESATGTSSKSKTPSTLASSLPTIGKNDSSSSTTTSNSKASQSVSSLSSSASTSSSSPTKVTASATPPAPASQETEASPSSSKSPHPPISQQTSFHEVKRAREERARVKVGGGIFRASGKNTIFDPRELGPGSSGVADDGRGEGAAGPRSSEAEALQNPASTTNWGASVSLGNATTTLFEFTKGWNRLYRPDNAKEMASVAERIQYITTIAPSSYPTMFQNSLEPPLLVGIFRTFKEALDGHQNVPDPLHTAISSILQTLLQVRRIRTVVMLLRAQEREVIRSVVDKVLHEGEEATWRSMLK